MGSKGVNSPLALEDELGTGVAPGGKLGGLQGDLGPGKVADFDLLRRETKLWQRQTQKQLALRAPRVPNGVTLT